jgi:serine/threonine-protein kinase
MSPTSESGSDLPTIGEHYKLEEKLGEGAFGQVYRAHHDLLDQDFAVKLLKPELSEDKDICDRFLDEARALIRFSHPNVVQMRHVGRHEGRLFLVMDYIEGVELNELMRRDGAFSEQRALALIKQILSGLEAAHVAGIVHRDLKPSNILVHTLPDGSEKASILDFGLSKFSAIDGPGGAHRSITGTIVGTLAYMSPEQIKGEKDIDGRSDLFAAGLILQEMLQGHHPYPGESGIVVAAKLLRDPIPPLDAEQADKVSDGTKSALSRALERDRDARFASVTAFSQCLEGRGPPSDTSRVTTVLEAQEELARREAAARGAAPKRAAAGAAAPARKRGVLLPVVIVAVVAAGVAAFFLLGRKPGSGAASTQTARTEGAGTQPETPAPETPEPKGTPAVETPPVSPTPGTEEPGTPEPGTHDPAGAATSPTTAPKDDGGHAPAAVPVPGKGEPAVEQPTGEQPAGSGKTSPAETAPGETPGEQPGVGQPATAPAGSSDPARATPGRNVTPGSSEATPPTKPTEIPSTPSPAAAVQRADALMQAGRWADARALYVQASVQAKPQDEVQVHAVDGAARSWIAEADGNARSGRLAAALDLYGQAVAWLKKSHDRFASVDQAVNVVPLQLGYSRMHEAECLVEEARWLRLEGKAKEAQASLTKAASAYEFALQTLDRRGVYHWEFLIRRARMYALMGETQKMLDDVRYATKTKDTGVPPHLWVAHAAAERRVAQALAREGKLTDALSMAKLAAKVATDGVSWQEDPKTGAYNLTRSQWLAMMRVVFVLATVLPASEDPNPLHGRFSYWLSEALKKKPAAWEPAPIAQAHLLTAQAMERYLAGRVASFRKKDAEAAKAYGEAAAKVGEALRLRTEAAAHGGELLDPLPFEVQAAILGARGDRQGAAKAAASAAQAALKNPD